MNHKNTSTILKRVTRKRPPIKSNNIIVDDMIKKNVAKYEKIQSLLRDIFLLQNNII